MLYILYALFLIFLRFIAGYDSRYQNGKYFVIRNPMLRKLLIDSVSGVQRVSRPKADINKISIIGVVLYFIAAFSLVGSIGMYFLIPQTKIIPFIFETDEFYMCADTLNSLMSAACMWLYLISFLVGISIWILQISKNEKKWIRYITYFAVLIIWAVAAGMIYLIVDAIVTSLV